MYAKYNEGIVAPYEADAQLGYLSKINYIDGVITEDSDLLVFGAKNVLLKLTPDANFTLIRLKDLGSVIYHNPRIETIPLQAGLTTSSSSFASCVDATT